MITKCRICGNTKLETVLDLGDMALTGLFPSPGQDVPRSPLKLIRCVDGCGLVQLADTYDLAAMYGDNYGYRSGLNKSMVKHLEKLVMLAQIRRPLDDGEVVVDIGSNDGTTLGFYRNETRRIGVDPTGTKFKDFYKPGVELIPDFFTAEKLKPVLGGSKASIVTSFSMFYDLEDPLQFMKEVEEVLADDGIWVMEQSYLPAMLKSNSFDTTCHEHLEYYALSQIVWMAERAALKVVGVSENDTNGGSFLVTLAKADSYYFVPQAVADMLASERILGLATPWPYEMFTRRVCSHIRELRNLLQDLARSGHKVYGLGASTKGNVLLQCMFEGSPGVQKIGDVNPDKWGKVTPGTNIPIISEDEALADKPDFFLVLPWHFKNFFIGNPKFKGCKLIFPLPQLEIVTL